MNNKIFQFIVFSFVLVMMIGCGGNKKNRLTEAASGYMDAYSESYVNAVEQARPSIMVIPGDRLLQNFKAISEQLIDSKRYVVRDYKSYLLKDDRAKRIISTIQKGFIDKDFPLNDFEQTLKQLDTQEASDMADGFKKDAKTMLLSVARPDIFLDFTYDTSGDKMSMVGHNYLKNTDKNISYTLSAIDAYTNKVIATITESNMKGESTTETIQEDIENKIPEFQENIVSYFSDILTKGRDVTIRVAIDKGCKLNLSDESIEGDTYSDWIIDYIKTHTVKGAYKMQTNTDKELYFVNCRIKLLNEDGTQYSVYDWARDLSKSLRTNLGIKCSNKSQGLGEILISIKGI